jgi:hypothetical protein
MYIGDMFCYGSSTDSVGVNGIVGCMGVFVASGQTLYAVHMPDSINYNGPGRTAFTQFVTGAGGWNAANATMIGVLNGDNRPGAGAELADIARGLGIGSFRTVRLRKHIDRSGSGEPVAAAVLCLFKPTTTQIELRYQMDSRVRWSEGNGEARAGQYRAMRGDSRLSTNPGWGAGWEAVGSDSCDLALTWV